MGEVVYGVIFGKLKTDLPDQASVLPPLYVMDPEGGVFFITGMSGDYVQLPSDTEPPNEPA